VGRQAIITNIHATKKNVASTATVATKERVKNKLLDKLHALKPPPGEVVASQPKNNCTVSDGRLWSLHGGDYDDQAGNQQFQGWYGCIADGGDGSSVRRWSTPGCKKHFDLFPSSASTQQKASAITEKADKNDAHEQDPNPFCKKQSKIETAGTATWFTLYDSARAVCKATRDIATNTTRKEKSYAKTLFSNVNQWIDSFIRHSPINRYIDNRSIDKIDKIDRSIDHHPVTMYEYLEYLAKFELSTRPTPSYDDYFHRYDTSTGKLFPVFLVW